MDRLSERRLKKREEHKNKLIEFAGVLNTFCSASDADKPHVIPQEWKKKPGGVIRELFKTWSFVFAANAENEERGPQSLAKLRGRDRLAEMINEIYGADDRKNPVRSLVAKLAASMPASVRDTIRIVAAIIANWPLDELEATKNALDRDAKFVLAKSFSEAFVRELLSHQSEGKSHDWTDAELEDHVFLLKDEVRISSERFVREITQEKGALIVAGAQRILVGDNPVAIIRSFLELTKFFADENNEGILIWVVDAGFLEAGADRFLLLYNLELLSTAMTTFAMMQSDPHPLHSLGIQKIDWSSWRSLSSRCCVVMRDPPVIDPQTGDFIPPHKIDDFICKWFGANHFEKLSTARTYIRLDGQHILPSVFPRGFGRGDELSGESLYWDVRVRPSKEEPMNLAVEYFVLPKQEVSEAITTHQARTASDNESPHAYHPQPKGRGRPTTHKIPIEGYVTVIKVDSPGFDYDQAQRLIYLAARGRLKLDTGEKHKDNLKAAAALRERGFETWPIDIMMSALRYSMTKAAQYRRPPLS